MSELPHFTLFCFEGGLIFIFDPKILDIFQNSIVSAKFFHEKWIFTPKICIFQIWEKQILKKFNFWGQKLLTWNLAWLKRSEIDYFTDFKARFDLKIRNLGKIGKRNFLKTILASEFWSFSLFWVFLYHHKWSKSS